MSFTSIPVLDLSLAEDPQRRPELLKQLRDALLNVGFLYIRNTGIDQDVFDVVCEECMKFFEELPEEEKLKIEMKNQKSFLGYSRLGNETTARAQDWREQLDLSTPHAIPGPSAPLYHNLLAPNQWPSASILPQFHLTISRYMTLMSNLSMRFTSLIAESLSLAPTAFDKYFDKDQQHKLKLVKYPAQPAAALPTSTNGTGSAGQSSANQGVGPHKDSMLTSYLLQASDHPGLQAQNATGEWVDCPPVKGTLVVAIGQGLEALTSGVCASTTHRVLSPAPNTGARYSVPFFQGVSYDSSFQAVDGISAQLFAARRAVVERCGGARIDDVEFTFVKGRWNHLGEATLWNRVKSHPDVGERWYPEILAQIRKEQDEGNSEGGGGGGAVPTGGNSGGTMGDGTHVNKVDDVPNGIKVNFPVRETGIGYQRSGFL